MSRKAIEKSSEVDIVIAQIQEYLNKNNMSVLALAKAANVSQPALCRFLAGKRKTVTIVAHQCISNIREDESQNYRHNNYAKNNAGTMQASYSIDGLIEAIRRGDHGSIAMAVSILDRLKPVLDLFTIVRDVSEGGDRHDNNKCKVNL